MKSHGARTGWRTLASTSWLLLLTGLSCKYNVTLPWVAPEDAKATQPDTSPDTSFDQAPVSPDLAIPNPDNRGCGREWTLQKFSPPLIVAIDRSVSMQSPFDSTTKMLAASSALETQVDNHPGISFSTIWFPWINCGGSACCASAAFSLTTGKKALPDIPGVCGASDAGCPSLSNDSPVYSALQQTRSFISKDPWGRWSSTLVLITDKNPSCANDPSDACDTASNEAARLGSELGVRVFVIVPTDGRTPDCLTWIATRNSQQPTTVRNQRELRDNLDLIANGIDEKPCRLYIVGTVDDPGPIERIEIAGTPIQHDETGKTGWKTVYGGAIQFPADLCKSIAKPPTPEVKAFTCRSGGSGGPSYGGP